MNRWWMTVAALAGALVLQVMLAPHLAVFGVVPDLLLLVVITLAFVEGPSAGAAGGFAAGFLGDLLGTGPIGAWALVLAVAGYAAGLLAENLFAEGWLAPATVAIITGLVTDASYLVVVVILGAGPDFWQALVSVVLPRAVYNSVLVLLAYPWLARLLRTDRSMKSFRRLA